MGDEEIAVLRCKFCGAPFNPEQISKDSSFITCSYCGTSQEKIDAEKYMNDVMTRVKAWVTKSLPMGYALGGTANIDPVARHSIFVKDVGPQINVECMTYRMSLMTLLGNRLLVLPFRNAKVSQISATSNSAFEFNAKVKSVSSLAVTEEDIELVNNASVVSECYALAINNIYLLSERKDGRWGIMSKNFSEAADALSKDEKFANPAKRFYALGKICDGFQKTFSGDPVSGYGLVKEGKEELESLRNEIMSDPQFNVMYNAIEQELTMATLMFNILQSTTSSGNDVMETMEIIRKVMDVASDVTHPDWKYILQNLHRYDEIFQNIGDIVQDAGGKLFISQGDGNILFPFWEADLKYTFVTGKLWYKKSVVVNENILVSSQFILDPGCFANPSSAVTDVFKNKPETRFMDSLKGNETTISGGCELSELQKTIIPGNINGRRTIIPITRKMEAEKLCSLYLSQKACSDDKFKLSDAKVKRLVYIPCKIENGSIILPKSFGNIVPSHISKLNPDKLMII